MEAVERVLLVDDDPLVRRCVMGQLEHIGCVFRTAESHELAIDLLKQDEKINFVLLDHGVTHGRVSDFVTAARSVRPNIQIIGCSGSDCRREFAAAGVHRFLLKPPKLPDLIDLLGLQESLGGKASDTRLGRADSETTCLRFACGQRVRVAVGSNEGLEGIVVGQRSGGKIMLQLERGVFMEIHQFCLEEII